MDPKIMNWLGIAAIAALVIITLGAVRFVGVYADSAEPRASFAATGEGKASAVPDVAEFSFGITTEGGLNVSSLQQQNTTKANAAINYVKSQGVEAKDIRTESYNISPRYQYFSCNGSGPCRPSEIVGYTISQTIHVKVRDFAKTGPMLAGVAEQGANNISSLSFKIDDLEKVKNEARAKAIESAKEKAEALAKAGGFKVGRILSIQESGSTPPPIYYAKLETSAGAADAQNAPSIEPGSDETTVNVTITYAIR